MNHVSPESMLAPSIIRALRRLDWEQLRELQKDSIRILLGTNKDLVISARTASGKTEAAFLPILSSIQDHPLGSIRALYIGPLKALINDQFRRLEDLCVFAEIPVHRWHGDVSSDHKKKLVKQPGGVLLITPESLESLFINKASALRSMFHSLSYVVIDELHAMEGNVRGTHLRSLLFRLDKYCLSPPRIVALSATIGDLDRTREWIRPGQAERVEKLVDTSGSKQVLFKIFAYQTDKKFEASDDDKADEESEINADLVDDVYSHHSLNKNLVFANSKSQIELLADSLNQLAARDGESGKYLVHHGSLSREIREQTEAMMQTTRSLTTVCSSTLELGIDIGNVASVGQVGAPYSVASMIQRLGRSGRKDGQPHVMKVYLNCPKPDVQAHLEERLYEELIRSIAMAELMKVRQVEKQSDVSGDLSTLIHQILSTIAEHGSVTVTELHKTLVRSGAFYYVPKDIFTDVLRALGRHDFIEQTSQNEFILGLKGEKEVGSYEFYPAFAVEEELRVIHQGEAIGLISARYVPDVNTHIVLAGRRWLVVGIHRERKEISVLPSKARRAPYFKSDVFVRDSIVCQKMKEILSSKEDFVYLSSQATELLTEAREVFESAGLRYSNFIRVSERSTLWFPWCGGRTQITLQGLLKLHKIDHQMRSFSIEIRLPLEELSELFKHIVASAPSPIVVSRILGPASWRKYDHILDDELLAWSGAQDTIDITGGLNKLSEAMPVG